MTNKYYKYKTKYLELKKISHSNIDGGSNFFINNFIDIFISKSQLESFITLKSSIIINIHYFYIFFIDNYIKTFLTNNNISKIDDFNFFFEIIIYYLRCNNENNDIKMYIYLHNIILSLLYIYIENKKSINKIIYNIKDIYTSTETIIEHLDHNKYVEVRIKLLINTIKYFLEKFNNEDNNRLLFTFFNFILNICNTINTELINNNTNYNFRINSETTEILLLDLIKIIKIHLNIFIKSNNLYTFYSENNSIIFKNYDKEKNNDSFSNLFLNIIDCYIDYNRSNNIEYIDINYILLFIENITKIIKIDQLDLLTNNEYINKEKMNIQIDLLCTKLTEFLTIIYNDNNGKEIIKYLLYFATSQIPSLIKKNVNNLISTTKENITKKISSVILSFTKNIKNTNNIIQNIFSRISLFTKEINNNTTLILKGGSNISKEIVFINNFLYENANYLFLLFIIFKKNNFNHIINILNNFQNCNNNTNISGSIINNVLIPEIKQNLKDMKILNQDELSKIDVKIVNLKMEILNLKMEIENLEIQKTKLVKTYNFNEKVLILEFDIINLINEKEDLIIKLDELKKKQEELYFFNRNKKSEIISEIKLLNIKKNNIDISINKIESNEDFLKYKQYKTELEIIDNTFLELNKLLSSLSTNLFEINKKKEYILNMNKDLEIDIDSIISIIYDLFKTNFFMDMNIILTEIKRIFENNINNNNNISNINNNNNNSELLISIINTMKGTIIGNLTFYHNDKNNNLETLYIYFTNKIDIFKIDDDIFDNITIISLRDILLLLFNFIRDFTPIKILFNNLFKNMICGIKEMTTDCTLFNIKDGIYNPYDINIDMIKLIESSITELEISSIDYKFLNILLNYIIVYNKHPDYIKKLYLPEIDNIIIKNNPRIMSRAINIIVSKFNTYWQEFFTHISDKLVDKIISENNINYSELFINYIKEKIQNIINLSNYIPKF